eukprot:Tamp_25064.p1 GENE.Tamp_25064~~Tamp_25064.p1  ORF type:complete len:124 (+),score=3.35 Tamp_25064:473-844(+)
MLALTTRLFHSALPAPSLLSALRTCRRMRKILLPLISEAVRAGSLVLVCSQVAGHAQLLFRSGPRCLAVSTNTVLSDVVVWALARQTAMVNRRFPLAFCGDNKSDDHYIHRCSVFVDLVYDKG